MTRARAAHRQRTLPALAIALLAWTATANAQRVERVGQGEPDLDRRIDALIAGEYTVIAENRLVAPNDTLRGTIVVAGARVVVEGVILGELVGLGGNVFLRPSGVVTGNVLNVAGGFYPSELAVVGGSVVSAPNAPYRIEQIGDVVRVIGLDRRPRFVTEGFRGLFLPSYDRVDALTIPVGGALLLPRAGRFEPRVRGRLEYRTARQRPTGAIELVAQRPQLRLAAGAQRTTLTSDEWIRPRWSNTLSYFFAGNDYFDHYEADRGYVEAVASGGEAAPLEAGLRLQVEDARSLPARNPWSLLNRDESRANRAIDDGRIVSAIAHGVATYSGTTAIIAAGALVELGRARMPLTWTAPETTPADFARYEFWTDLALAGFLDHTLEIDANLRGPLPGTENLPRQRWTHVGGDRTLYTVPIAEFQGDRLAHVHTRYAIPFAGVRLPLLGPPTLDLVHVAAMAWERDQHRTLEQNVGAGVRAGFLFVRYMINPADTRESQLAVGLTLPGRRRPWEER